VGPPPDERLLRGHRRSRLGASPFAPTLPAIVAALGYLLAVALWSVAGDHLPGGRWLAVHLFTLGVLTNLVFGFTHHFARTLTRTGEARPRWRTLVLNLGVLTVLVGLPFAATPVVAVGGTVVIAAIFESYLRLRRSRRAAVGARFAWIVRVYERAHGAFIHGALLGVLLGVGLLPGTWYAAGRLAHLHVNVLGWGGLTLLATLVFFGPTMTRTRIRPGADDVAARALRWGAAGLTLGVVSLLASGLGGAAGTGLRVLAAVALAVFAWATTRTCTPVIAAARGASPSPARWHVIATSTWFVVAVWVDVVVVASGAWRFLDALGAAALLGVLGQGIVTALGYVAPMLRSRSFAGRDTTLARLERGARLRVTAYNLGVATIVASGVLDAPAALARAGWIAVSGAVAAQLLASVWPVHDEPDRGPRSRIARRYRRPTSGQTHAAASVNPS
jgi:hypothetical protein